MEPQHAQANGDSALPSHIEPGEFPFPLTGGPAESPYLTWLRNHSNYMAARGLFDYLRAVSLLGRGIVVNFLIFMPYLLVVAIVLAYAHHWMREHPFFLTLGVLACAVAWILLFSVMAPLFRIVEHKRSVETGSDSSVKHRDLYERSFGALLLVLLAAAALESEPWVLEFLHDRILLGRIGWPGGLAAASVGLALLGSSNKLLSALTGARKQVAMVLVGLLGLLVPLIVILSATDFLLYGLPPTGFWMFSPLAVPAVGVLLITIAMALGLWRKVFTGKEILAVVGLLFVALALGLASILLGYGAMKATQESMQALEETFSKVNELAQQFEEISDRRELAPEVAALVNQFVEAGRELEAAQARQAMRARDLPQDPGPALPLVSLVVETSREAQGRRDLDYALLPLVSLGDELSAQPEKDLAPLKSEITRLAYGELQKLVGLRGEQAAELLRGTFITELVRGAFVTNPCAVPLAPSRNEPGQDRDPLRIAERFRKAVDNCDPTVLEKDLRQLELDLNDLDRAELARLAGEAELAELLAKKGLAALVLPSEAGERKELLARALRTWALEHALPAFPAPGAPDSKQATLDTARALARLAKSQPTPEKDLVSESLAFFFSTREEGPPGDSAVEGDPAGPEIARAAGRVLARRVLEDFDVDHLRALAFGLDGWPAGVELEPEQVAAKEESLIDAMAAAADPARLQEFLELAERPLEELVIEAFRSPLPGPARKERKEEIWDLLPYQWPDEYRNRVLLAGKALGNDTEALAKLARGELIDRGLNPETTTNERKPIVEGFATHDPRLVDSDHLARLWVARFLAERATTEDLVVKLVFGELGRLEKGALSVLESQWTKAVLAPKVIFVSLLLVVIWLGCWLTVDVNLTSIHGLYRDRLASAFLVGRDTKGDIDIEADIDLEELCRYEARSTAPYHLLNVALNLQGSKDIGIRDRKSDFFIFSKRFIGGHRTGYCRSETMEQVFPQMDLATAMAVSAAAASPNMGRATSPFLVAFMTLVNVRLGFWVPNPGLLEEKGKPSPGKWRRNPRRATQPIGFTFQEVFAEELHEIERRWGQVYPGGSPRKAGARDGNRAPAVEHGLVGIGFSGGGIRSAAINLGITQALHQYGVFDHVDYMSTVSGGGYVGSSISTLMRSREKLCSEIEGTVAIEAKDEQIVIVQPSAAGETARTYRFSRYAALNVRDGEHVSAGKPLLRPRAARGKSDIAGTVTVARTATGEPIVTVQGEQSDEHHDYRFSRFDSLVVKTGDTVKAGDKLIRRHDTLGERFRWRVRPRALLRELRGHLDETHRWVNISDGGHIENLAGIELLRRRCKYILLGDGEADPRLHFAGLARLMRYAHIDLGIRIDIDLDAIRLAKAKDDKEEGAVSGAQWAFGTITYPEKDGNGQPEIGYLLYLKSSCTGHEGEMIREYRHRNPTFPHQTTADQSFDEDQFEAYRALGQHIAEAALPASDGAIPPKKMSFSDFEDWFAHLAALPGSLPASFSSPSSTPSSSRSIPARTPEPGGVQV